MMRIYLTFLIGFLCSHTLWAEGVEDVDNTVAAGIVFKVSYVMGAQGTWSDTHDDSHQSFSLAMATIANDLSAFSDSEHGRELKKHGEALISFLKRGVTSTRRPGDPDGEKFLEEVGLDPKSADPAQLAQIFSDRIAAYAKLSGTPSWVYDSTKRE